MSVTMTLREELADDLARQAQARRMSLISKEYETGLTEAEAAELAVLQDAAAKACEPQDRKLSGSLSALEQEADYPSALPHE